MKLRRVSIVYNPKGGTARQDAAQLLADSLSRAKVTAVPTTPEPGSATRLARAACADGADLVVAMGGDGTACQVAEGLLGSNIPMAVYPQGTGNLFARAFFTTPTVDSFVMMMERGEPQPVDMIRLSYNDLDGREHNRMFMVALGVGKLSDAVSQTSVKLKRMFGKLAYAVRVGASGLRPDPKLFSLMVNGEGRGSFMASTIMVMNVLPPNMGFVSPGCCASDGLMDVGVLEVRNWWQMLKVGVCALFHNPEYSGHYFRFRAKELVIECSEPVNPNIDGDPSHLTRKLRLSMVPRAVQMVLSA